MQLARSDEIAVGMKVAVEDSEKCNRAVEEDRSRRRIVKKSIFYSSLLDTPPPLLKTSSPEKKSTLPPLCHSLYPCLPPLSALPLPHLWYL